MNNTPANIPWVTMTPNKVYKFGGMLHSKQPNGECWSWMPGGFFNDIVDLVIFNSLPEGVVDLPERIPSTTIESYNITIMDFGKHD